MLVKKYAGYMINSFQFHTKSCEIGQKTQKSNIVMIAQTESYSTFSDRKLISEAIDYFCVISEIIELRLFRTSKRRII